MKIKFFTIPINAVESFEKEINAFFGTHKSSRKRKAPYTKCGASITVYIRCIYNVYIQQVKVIYITFTKHKKNREY